MKTTIAALALVLSSSQGFAMCLGTNCPPPANSSTQFLHQWNHDQAFRALQNAQPPSIPDPSDAMARLYQRMHEESMQVPVPPQRQGPSIFDVVADHIRREQLHEAQLRMLDAQRRAYEAQAQAARNGDNECFLERNKDGTCFHPKRVGGEE